MKSEEEFDDLFRDKLSESSGHYSPENWERMQLLLNASHGAKGAFIWSRLNNMVAVVGVGVGAFVGSQLFFGESTSTKLDFSKTIQREIPSYQDLALSKPNEIESTVVSSTESGTVKEMISGNQAQSTAALSKGNYIVGSAGNVIASAKRSERQENEFESGVYSSKQSNAGVPPELNQENNVVAVNSIAESENAQAAESVKSIEVPVSTESAKILELTESNTVLTEKEIAEVQLLKPEEKLAEETQEESAQEVVLANEVKIPAEESPAVITDPIITSNKVLPVNFGFEAGIQMHKPWGEQTNGSIASGYSAGAILRVEVQPKLSLNTQLNFAYRSGVNLPKTSYVYAYDFNLVKIPITVNVNGLATGTLMAGARYSLGNFGALEANVGGQFIMDTHAKVSSTVDTIPLPSGNWGYRSGVKRWDWMAGIGYDYGFCKHFEGFAYYRMGFNKDNTDDQYFGSSRADVNRYLQVGLRYFIKPSENNVRERFK